MLYHEYYTWQCCTDDYVIGHSDGTCSLAFTWTGLDHKLFNEADYDGTIKNRLNLLNRLSNTGLTVENHWFRSHDESMIDAYLAKNKDIVRGHDLAIKVREEMAEHYRPLAMNNRVITIFTLSPGSASRKLSSIFQSKTNKKVSLWETLSLQLHILVGEFKNDFPGMKLLNKDEAFSLLSNSYSLNKSTTSYDSRYDMSEQLVINKPELSGQCLFHNGKYIKYALIQKYPTLTYDWMLNFSSQNCDTHISQVLRGVDRQKALRKSTEQSDTDERTTGGKDTELLVKDLDDAQSYRSYIAQYNLSVFSNAFIISFISDDKDTALEHCSNFTKVIGDEGGLARVEPELQMHLHRVSQPGLGHHSQFRREDHSASIACMLPWTVFSSGNPNPESIRLSSDYQVIGYSPTQLQVGHEINFGKTGGGKDTHGGTEVAETYPLGFDYYILEFGDSYKWVVQGYGGTYSTIDPDSVIINPLPDYTDARGGVLPSQISSGTAQGLAIILLDDARDLTRAEESATERALGILYSNPDPSKAAPTLPDLLDSFRRAEYINSSQSDAAAIMSNNLENFLDGSSGRAFKGQDNLSLSDGITGIDLVKVDKKMLKFYLTFICLRFAQKAFFNLEQHTKIILNELHVAIDVAPEVVKHLIRTINRMGRKEGSFIMLTTQGMNEIHAIDSEIVTSSPIRTLQVRTDSWQDIGTLLDMPSKAIDIWSQYNQDTDNMNFRQCMRKLYGQWFDLYMTFPPFLLDITSTSRNDRLLKHKVERDHTDIFSRINELRKLRSQQ